MARKRPQPNQAIHQPRTKTRAADGRNVLFPVAALQRARPKGELRFVGRSAPFADPVCWQKLLAALAHTDSVVYCKPPLGSPAQVLKYLSRYTHRVAIANRRLRFVGNGVVRFAYRDSAAHDPRKEMTSPAPEFLRRFLLHVVPRGFMRIRHYGITANRQRQRKLHRARALLGGRQPAPTATASPPPPRPPPTPPATRLTRPPSSARAAAAPCGSSRSSPAPTPTSLPPRSTR